MLTCLLLILVKHHSFKKTLMILLAYLFLTTAMKYDSSKITLIITFATLFPKVALVIFYLISMFILFLGSVTFIIMKSILNSFRELVNDILSFGCYILSIRNYRPMRNNDVSSATSHNQIHNESNNTGTSTLNLPQQLPLRNETYDRRKQNAMKKNCTSEVKLKVYSELSSKEERSEEKRCDICLIAYEDTDIVSQSCSRECKHYLHADCIIYWLKRNHLNCPICTHSKSKCDLQNPNTERNYATICYGKRGR